MFGWDTCCKYKDAATALRECIDWAQGVFHPDSTLMNSPPPPSPVSEAADDAVEPTSELEPWMSFEPDPKRWANVLSEEFNCDRTSIQELFCLAQHSDEGWKAANLIISKLLKKRSDHEEIRNPSAFVHSCAKSARHSLDQSG